MRYHGKGSPSSVLASCLTLGFLPQILFILFLIWLPWWVYVLVGCVGLMWWILKEFAKENKHGKE